jgi:ABC-type sugar transport system ATPase subunit
MFGLTRLESGTLTMADSAAKPLPGDPREAFQNGIAYLSDDRRRDGLVGIRSIGDNLVMSSLDALSSLGWIDTAREGEMAQRYFRQMGVKAPNLATPGDSLSGGNQQKVCLGRVIATGPRLLILDEPTRGIDVGVKEDVHRQIDALTNQGMSVIIVTTDLDEMVRAVDRVCVFSGGAIVETLVGADITKERLRAAAFDRGANNNQGTSLP